MSKIKITELEPNFSELKPLSERETSAIVGGSNAVSEINLSIDIFTGFQINNNVNFQIAINGDNLNLADLVNNVDFSNS